MTNQNPVHRDNHLSQSIKFAELQVLNSSLLNTDLTKIRIKAMIKYPTN